MVDQLLGGLFGSQDPDDEPTGAGGLRIRRSPRARRARPDERCEVLQNYRAATARLSPDEYRQVTADALRKLPPEQRREFKRQMRQQARQTRISGR